MLLGRREGGRGWWTHVRRRLEALHRLAEALAELGKLAGTEEDRRDAANDHNLGEAEAEEAHMSSAFTPDSRTVSAATSTTEETRTDGGCGKDSLDSEGDGD